MFLLLFLGDRKKRGRMSNLNPQGIPEGVLKYVEW